MSGQSSDPFGIDAPVHQVAQRQDNRGRVIRILIGPGPADRQGLVSPFNTAYIEYDMTPQVRGWAEDFNGVYDIFGNLVQGVSKLPDGTGIFYGRHEDPNSNNGGNAMKGYEFSESPPLDIQGCGFEDTPFRVANMPSFLCQSYIPEDGSPLPCDLRGRTFTYANNSRDVTIVGGGMIRGASGVLPYSVRR
jgi:hypothetical protein